MRKKLKGFFKNLTVEIPEDPQWVIKKKKTCVEREREREERSNKKSKKTAKIYFLTLFISQLLQLLFSSLQTNPPKVNSKTHIHTSLLPIYTLFPFPEIPKFPISQKPKWEFHLAPIEEETTHIFNIHILFLPHTITQTNNHHHHHHLHRHHHHITMVLILHPTTLILRTLLLLLLLRHPRTTTTLAVLMPIP